MTDLVDFCRAIAPEATGLLVISKTELRSRAPAFVDFHHDPRKQTLGSTSPGMGAAMGIEAPVIALDLDVIRTHATEIQKWREPIEDVIHRVTCETCLHEAAHVLVNPPPYFGTLDPGAVGHSPQFARLVFALCIRASVAGLGDFRPGSVIGRGDESALWDAFRPQLSAWGGRGIEVLKAMPLPQIASPAPATPRPLSGLPMLDEGEVNDRLYRTPEVLARRAACRNS